MTHYDMPVLHHIPINQVVKKYVPVYYPVPVEHRINIPVKVPIKIQQRVNYFYILGLNTSSSSLRSENSSSNASESRNTEI